MGVGVKVHPMLTLHSHHAMHRALIVELAVLLVGKVNLIDVLGVFLERLPARRPLGDDSTQKHQQCCDGRGKKRKSNPNFHHVASHKIRLKFHSPIAQTICTLNFILGLFASVTELRLAGVCFLCDARDHEEIAIHTRARSELHFVALFMLQFHNDTCMDNA